jgi:hypothetical protein
MNAKAMRWTGWGLTARGLGSKIRIVRVGGSGADYHAVKNAISRHYPRIATSHVIFPFS